MSLPTLLNRTSGDPLQAARSRRAIGYLGWDVPVELILAAGAVPVQLSALSSSRATTLADRFLENSFSAQSRVVAERWLAGDLDCLEAVVFSRSDDNAQRLYYYLCELQRMGECKGPRPLLYDLARIQRGTSVAHTIESTRALAGAIGVDESGLSAAMERVAARERLLDRLTGLRLADDVPLGSTAYQIVRGARADWSEEFDRSLQAWLDSPATVAPSKRVLLVGSVPADDHVHAAIEVNGAVVVGEINDASTVSVATRYAGDPLAITGGRGGDAASATPISPQRTGDLLPVTAGRGGNAAWAPSAPLERIARRYYQRTNAIGALLKSPADLVKAARAMRADGVIGWMLATDTGLAWEAPRIERALREASLPTLMLTSQPQTLNADALTQIAQFQRALEAQ